MTDDNVYIILIAKLLESIKCVRVEFRINSLKHLNSKSYY